MSNNSNGSVPAHGPAVAGVRIAIVGYGEVGSVLGEAFRARGVACVRAYDIAADEPVRGDAMRGHAASHGVTLDATLADALVDAELVVSAVTASQSLAVATAAAQGLPAGAFYLDLNSASPATKSESGARIAAARGRYVEAGVMTSVPPHGIAVPMLIGGPDAEAASPLLDALGFRASIVSHRIGVASAIKMCRSVVIKGLEAIMLESLLTARRHGVEMQVIASLAETFPGLDWDGQGDYFWQRVRRHGRRRAEEMREAAVTVREAGLVPLMSVATAERQAWMAALAASGVFNDLPNDAPWRALADRIERPDDSTGAA